MNFKYIQVFVLIFSLIVLSGCQIVRISSFSKKVSYEQLPFEQNKSNASLKILILGDSTGVGTGAKPTESVAGWFAQDFPNAQITNISQNGQRLSGIVNNFPELHDHYNLIVLQIGANDIMRLTRLKTVEKELAFVVDHAKNMGDHVAMLHSADVGLAPIFSWPLNSLYSSRSRAVRNIYIKMAKDKNVMYVDIFKEKKDDLFLKDINKYYSSDMLHPSGQGYRHWYEEIRKTLDQNSVKL